MTSYDYGTAFQVAVDLRVSITELTERGLLVASKWASELLTSLPQKAISSSPLHVSTSPETSLSPLRTGISRPREATDRPLTRAQPAGPSRPSTALSPADTSTQHKDQVDLARTYFEMKEYDRVAFTLRTCNSHQAKFLRIYSKFLSADRKAQDSLPHFMDTKEERFALYPALNPLLIELADDDDPYLLYLRGILHMRLDQKTIATQCLIQSLKTRPYNWSAWSQLAQLVTSADAFIELKERLPQGPMLTFFAIAVMLDLHTATDLVMRMITELLEVFPQSVHLLAQRALVYYHCRDFTRAEQWFDEVQRVDPYRMEDVDIFSNMLYVMDKRGKLGKLAHEYAEIDRNRAEVCCLIGNYYSSRGDHTKAITYFRRALMLNREYLPAWTLMGHEFVELKNSHAAIEAYRKGIDINPKDYRAWYGLGQAYELLDMPLYAIEYYNQATSLRPYDSRMWGALASVYESLHKISDAILAHTRALLGADPISTLNILSKLASLYTIQAENVGDQGSLKAIECHRKLIALGEQKDAMVALSDLAESYLAVADWELHPGGLNDGKGDATLAAEYLNKVAQSHVPQRDKAEEMLRALRLRETQ